MMVYRFLSPFIVPMSIHIAKAVKCRWIVSAQLIGVIKT